MKNYPLFFILFLFACQSPKGNAPTLLSQDSVKSDSSTKQLDIEDRAFMDTLKAIQGYRFVVIGDFNGDGSQDSLVEHYYSQRLKKEASKFYENLDYDANVGLAVQKNALVYLLNPSGKIDSLVISRGGQTFGCSFVKNEGDLDGNGTDELSYVEDYADWSSINTCHLMTYTKVGWKQLYQFTLHDWELPPTPQTSTNYGMFGAEQMSHYADDDSLNRELEKALKEFSFIQKVKPGTIKVSEIEMEDDENSDTSHLGDRVIKIVKLPR